MSIKDQARNSTFWATLSATASAAIQLLQIMILARVLDKKDFGLLAMATTITAISQIFMDLGLSNAVIQKKNITHLQLTTLFWLNIIVGLSISLVIFVSAPSISHFYEEPELVRVLHFVGITFFIQSFGQQHTALLHKELVFKPVALAILISRITGLVISIFLANDNFAIYSLVYSNLLAALIYTSIILYSGLKIYKPSLNFLWASVKNNDFFSFGSYQMAAKLIFYLTFHFDTILIGRLLSTESLGIYNLSKTLAFKSVDIISTITSKVTLPILARYQDDPIGVRRIYFQILKLSVTVNSPICMFMILFTRPLVIICFGRQWVDAATYVQWLSIAAFTTNIWGTIDTLLLSQGKARLDFIANTILLFLIPLSLLVGERWKIIGIVLLQVLTRFIFLLFAWFYIKKAVPTLNLANISESFVRPIILTASLSIPIYFIAKNLNDTNIYLTIFIGILSIFSGTGIFLLIFDKSYFGYIKNLLLEKPK